MVENIFRQLATARRNAVRAFTTIIATRRPRSTGRSSTRSAVIIASFLPIYVLTGPSGELFEPMADTTIFALIGALIVTLTLLPVLCAWLLRKRRARAAQRRLRVDSHRATRAASTLPARGRWRDDRRVVGRCFARLAAADPVASARSSCRSSTRARCGCARRCRTRSRSTSRRRSSPQIRAILRSFPEVTIVASEHGRPDDGTDPTGFFNAEFFVGLKPYSEWTRPIRTEAGADRRDRQEARGLSRASSSTTPSRRRTRSTRRRRGSRARWR